MASLGRGFAQPGAALGRRERSLPSPPGSRARGPVVTGRPRWGCAAVCGRARRGPQASPPRAPGLPAVPLLRGSGVSWCLLPLRGWREGRTFEFLSRHKSEEANKSRGAARGISRASSQKWPSSSASLTLARHVRA